MSERVDARGSCGIRDARGTRGTRGTAGNAAVGRRVAALWLGLWLGAASPLAAQTDSGAVARDIARRLAAIAKAALRADSAHGTDAAHIQVAPAVAYAADRFSEWGLVPGPPGERAADNPWLQTYPVPGQRQLKSDSIALTIGTFLRKAGVEVVTDNGVFAYEIARTVRLPLGTAVPLVSGSVSEGTNGLYLGITFSSPLRPKPVIVAGPHTPASAAKVVVRGKVVFYVLPAGLDSLRERQIVDTLARAGGGSKGIVVVTDEDSTHFVARRRGVRPLPVIDEYLKRKLAARTPVWTTYVRADSLRYLFTLAGLDLAALRQAPTPVARESLPLSAWFSVLPLAGDTVRPLVANAVGVVEGSDSALRRQYVIVSAHADADASGVAALLAVARAFSDVAVRPRRSLLFVVTSGAAHDFAGAEYVAAKLGQTRAHAVANLTLDPLGRAAGDSVAIDGLDEIELGTPPGWVTAAHPELGLTVVNGSVLAAPCTEHCAFVRRKVPSLYLHDLGVTHDTISAHRRASAPSAADTTHTARVARLAFYLTEAIANAARSARWSAEAGAQLDAFVGD